MEDELLCRYLSMIEDVDEPVFNGYINRDNIPPPAYDGYESDESEKSPEYFASYLSPPEYTENPDIQKGTYVDEYEMPLLPSYLNICRENGKDEFKRELWGNFEGARQQWNQTFDRLRTRDYYNMPEIIIEPVIIRERVEPAEIIEDVDYIEEIDENPFDGMIDENFMNNVMWMREFYE